MMNSPDGRADYLHQLKRNLRRINPSDRDEILREIEGHFADAREEGRDDRVIIAALGDPRQLALAYELELAGAGVPSNRPRFSRGERRLLLIPLLAGLSLPTFIAVAVLGSLAISLTIGGVALTIGGGLILGGADPEWINWKYSPELALAAGPAMAVAGSAAGYLLMLYLRATARALRKLLPRR